MTLELEGRMRSCVLLTLLLSVAVSYYLYLPLPGAVAEPWKLMLLDGAIRAVMHLVSPGQRVLTSS